MSKDQPRTLNVAVSTSKIASPQKDCILPSKFIKFNNEKRIVRVKRAKTQLNGSTSADQCQKSYQEPSLYISQAVKETIEMLLQKVELDLSIAQDHLDDLQHNSPIFAIKKINFAAPEIRALVGDAIIEKPSCSKTISTTETNSAPQQKQAYEDVFKHLRLLPGSKKRSEVTVRRKRKFQSTEVPIYESGQMLDLEPGEVPSQNYVPPLPEYDSKRRVYCSVYPCPELLMNVPFYLYNYVPRAEIKEAFQEIRLEQALENCDDENEEGELEEFLLDAVQASKSIRELFEAAKQKAQLFKDDPQRKTFDEMVKEEIQPVFPAFPDSSASDFRKLSWKEKQYLPKPYKIQFTNNLAVIRYFKNRWVMGGRLTMTGKFEECSEEERLLLALEQEAKIEAERKLGKEEGGAMDQEIEDDFPPIVPPPKVKIQVQYIYEDTHQYVEYMKHQAESHGERFRGDFEDEMTSYLRKWYQYYKYAVQFVDIPDEFKDEFAKNEADAEEAEKASKDNLLALTSVQELPLIDKLELYYQQWRWKQVHQYKQGTVLNRNEDQKTDDLSFKSQPVLYSGCNNNQWNGPGDEEKIV